MRSALRSQVAAGAKLAQTLTGLCRFSVDASDVEWASSGAGALFGVGSARRHVDAGFSTRGAKPINSVRRAALSRDREDVAASRAAAAIEDKDEVASIDDGALMEAEAFECARQHEAALAAAREATKACMDARKFAQEVSLRANRLVANSDSRANAAFQGAQDAMNESSRAEYLAMEAEIEAEEAERRANALSKSLGSDHPEVLEAFRRAADAATSAVTLSSAHVAAARVAERALDIAEEHKRAADLIKKQASDDVEAARSRVFEAEAALMATAKAEREMKMKAMRATASLRHATGDAPSNVDPSEERFSTSVFSPTKRRSAEEKQIARRRLTWASFGDDDDDDDAMQLRGVSLAPGKWVTLAECATQAYAKRLAFKSLRGFAVNVEWRRRQREAALLALVTKAFTTWAELARVHQSRRKLVESVVDEVLVEDRARRLHVYMMVLQKHAKWRRARCEELRLSLRRVVAPTVLRPAFDDWKAKVGRILLVRRVINRGIAAWKARGNRPSHANAFYRMYDAFIAWRAFSQVKREQRRRTAAAREYHRVALALRVMKEWRRASRQGRARAHDLAIDLEEFRIRRRLRAKRSAFSRWRAETLRRGIHALSLEHSPQTLTSGALNAWRSVTAAASQPHHRPLSPRVPFAL